MRENVGVEEGAGGGGGGVNDSRDVSFTQTAKGRQSLGVRAGKDGKSLCLLPTPAPSGSCGCFTYWCYSENYLVKVVLFRQFTIKGETSTFYRLITCKVNHLKRVFVGIWLIKTSNPKTEKQKNTVRSFSTVGWKCHTRQVSNPKHLQMQQGLIGTIKTNKS